MTFTDDDLAVLKELSKASVYWSPKIPALLARLEAAEIALDKTTYHQCGSGNYHVVARSKYERWLKVAGK